MNIVISMEHLSSGRGSNRAVELEESCGAEITRAIACETDWLHT